MEKKIFGINNKSYKSKKGYYFCFRFFHNYARIKINSSDSLPLTLHNVIILVKSVLNENQNYFYNNMFLEKGLYQLAEK